MLVDGMYKAQIMFLLQEVVPATLVYISVHLSDTFGFN